MYGGPISTIVQDQFFRRRVECYSDGNLSLEISVVLMSRETADELLRENGYSSNAFQWPQPKLDTPYLYGVRVAFDDSLALGEIMVGRLFK